MINSVDDGYYLSIYSEIDPIFNVQGYSLRHDHNMALFEKRGNNINLMHHWEFERITGLKHHQVSFYSKEDAIIFINELLEEYSLSIDDMSAVIGIPQLSTCNDYYCFDECGNLSFHSICHMFSSALMNSDIFFNEKILALAFDGGPDVVIDKSAFKKNSYCGALIEKGKLSYFPIPSPGPFWLHLSRLCEKPEGTLMALASSTTATYKGTAPILIDNFNTIDSHKNMKRLRDFYDMVIKYPDEKIQEICDNFDCRFSFFENKLSMIAKIIQGESLKSVYRLLDDLCAKYQINPKSTYISLSGGYALNCPTNTAIMKKYKFKGQLICPCVNDSGLSIGMALYYFYKKYGFFNFCFNTPYIGNSDYNLNNAIKNFAPFIKKISKGIKEACDDIIRAPIVWFEGKGESGPRALGHRSILANPVNLESKVLLNQYKQREWWRPVAPIVLEEYMKDWFQDSFCSPYMLNNFVIKTDKETIVPAIIHLDKSARIQTITHESNNLLYDIVHNFYAKTGVPILCNTSLNDKGEPIVNNCSEALNFALRKGIKIAYLNGYRIELHKHSEYLELKPYKRFEEFFVRNKNKKEILLKLNPYELSITELLIRIFNEELHCYQITSEKDVEYLKCIIKKIRTVSDIYDDLFEKIIL